ncbi:T9SS type A sorting domain-containing protein [Flavobacterium sp. J372]|uniref:type IX secretion system anionic LPS delivery protein PorZ n=1 Tax=Flavobacterium sp. J372 TaxID=2898436 RepID=UPI00215129F8|nr:two-component regulator propeller domain-containing protein [Flavobacterium sp. J372]MCR5861044.1 T9SS type A sorting domain-containing protein [Flavobacterium sp. J372]
MKRVLQVVALLAAICCAAQNNNKLWGSHFSYNNIVDISQSGSRVYAAADFAMFSKNVLTNELKTITSVDGLKAETITAIHHSTVFNRTLVGNSNGLLLVINADNTIATKVDIIAETTVQPNKKRINHIYEHQGKAYIATDFGIAVLNIATLEFGDTFYLGPNGAEISVNQVTVQGGYIYAACKENGLRRGLISNPNLNDFNNWVNYNSGYWVYASTLDNMLIAADNQNIYRLEGNSFVIKNSTGANIVDFRVVDNNLLITTPSFVKIFNSQVMQTAVINVIPCLPLGETASFTCATLLNQRLYVGTTEKGLYSMLVSNFSVCENITPSGPLRSNIFSLEKTANNLWAVFGGYNIDYNPYIPTLNYFGISRLNSTGWLNIPNSDVFGAAAIVDIIATPANENVLYAASFLNGLIKIENNVGVEQYDATPPIQNGPETVAPGGPTVWINSLAYDREGNLWMTNALTVKSIKVLKAGGDWAAYSLQGIVQNPEQGLYGKMVIDKNGTKWIPSRDNGLIAFNEKQNNRFVILKDNSNLPDSYVRSLAIDNRNQLWIGTRRGLRILPSVDRFLTEDALVTNDIIILEDGQAQELLYQQDITAIKVDGANNKWLGTATAGVFLVSPDGQRTIHHFTILNSPLPSNQINDIAIDAATGEVFFATDKGMVSFKGTSTKASDNLDNVYVFPNPVRPGFEGDVNISGLINRANVKITDIEGNLVHETTSEGGTILWDTRAFGKHKVASGVYMIFITGEDGTQTKVKKVMIIR